jgi:transposase
MPRGLKLNDSEIKVINNLHAKSTKISKIAELLNRSRKVISNYLKDPDKYRKKHGGGRPRAISARDRRALLRVASNSAMTARQIATEAGVTTHIRNVQRVLKAAPNLQLRKLRCKPVLTEKHKAARFEFAKEHVYENKFWRKVIFSDEKKFNLDGPDGFRYYFHDLRKDEKILSRRQAGGGTVMVWAGIGFKGKTDIKFISGTMNSSSYIQLLDEQLRRHGTRIAGRNFVFQQDNAAVHSAHIVKQYFHDRGIKVLAWPAKSPDLNIIENCWADLSRAVYAAGRQFKTVNELKEAIEREWAKLSLKRISALYDSLPNRMVEVIAKNGGSTHY